jgi:hypothetical protein
MTERTWVTFITPHQALPGRRIRIDADNQVWTVKERIFLGQPRREHILCTDGSTIPVSFARRKRWQIEVPICS